MALRDAVRELAVKYAPQALAGFRLVRALVWNSVVRMDVTFDDIYRNNSWGSGGSRSGPGSTPDATRSLRQSLPNLLKELEARTLVDAPCGDYWMRLARLDLDSYIGVDVVGELIDHNNRLYGSSHRRFLKLNLAKQSPPRADVIVCRDLLIHLSFGHAFAVLRNFQRSGSTYLLCSHNPDHQLNHDIMTGSFRPLNLCIEPFKFMPPDRELADDPPRGAELKGAVRRTMALWRLQEMNVS